jgi:hypothetical protein
MTPRNKEHAGWLKELSTAGSFYSFYFSHICCETMVMNCEMKQTGYENINGSIKDMKTF